MHFIEMLEEDPLSEVVRYRSGTPKDAVAFTGTLRKHPYDNDKCILLADPVGPKPGEAKPAILEFRKADIQCVEELASLVDETGHSRQVMRLWIRHGSLGLRYEPFEVGEQQQSTGLSKLRDRIVTSLRS
jgi:hypothetical protein